MLKLQIRAYRIGMHKVSFSVFHTLMMIHMKEQSKYLWTKLSGSGNIKIGTNSCIFYKE